MNYYQVVIFSASVFIATIIGWVRFRKTGPGCFPFLLCLTLASVNEILSFLLTKAGLYTTINNNIYVLFEALLIIWQFKNWGLFGKYNAFFFLLLAAITITWMLDNFLVTDAWNLNLYFRITCSFIIVLMSIHINNTLIITYRRRLLQNPVFLICTGFIIYFTYKILIEAFWLYGLNKSRDFRISVYLLLTWINLFTNLIYAFAMLWIPKRSQHVFINRPLTIACAIW